MTTQNLPQTLSDWLVYMGSIHVSAIDLGLGRVQPVAAKLGVLKEDLVKQPFVFTVAGTNGKGSTTATIAQICQAAGLKTALYQSPHLVSFTERVRIDGVECSDETLIAAFSAVEAARVACGVSLSFFEMTTLAAFYIFAKADCDVWVLEIGLGGRLDVVNIITPNLAVITNIGIDHTDWLGDDIEQIGSEKAGIIRDGIPVVLGDGKFPDSVHRIAKEKAACVYQLGVDYDYFAQENAWIYSSASLTMSLDLPNLSLMNAATAVSAVLASDLPIAESAIRAGVAAVQLAGRFDRRVLNDRHWVFDVAHNADGIAFLLSQWQAYWQAHLAKYPQARLSVLFSMLGDKDVGAVLKKVAAADLPIQAWHIAAIDHERAMPLEMLRAKMDAFLPNANIVEYPNLAAATHGTIAATDENDLIVAFGSFHTIGESLVALIGKNF